MLFRRRKCEAPAPVPKRSGPVDRLLTLPDVELDLSRVIEGASAHFCSVPLEGNPWPRDCPALWQGWRTGWLGASFTRDYYEADDAERWLIPTAGGLSDADHDQ